MHNEDYDEEASAFLRERLAHALDRHDDAVLSAVAKIAGATARAGIYGPAWRIKTLDIWDRAPQGLFNTYLASPSRWEAAERELLDTKPQDLPCAIMRHVAINSIKEAMNKLPKLELIEQEQVQDSLKRDGVWIEFEELSEALYQFGAKPLATLTDLGGYRRQTIWSLSYHEEWEEASDALIRMYLADPSLWDKVYDDCANIFYRRGPNKDEERTILSRELQDLREHDDWLAANPEAQQS